MTATTDGALVDLLGETRAKVVELVHQEPRTVSELATVLGLSDVAVRRHVRELVDRGLLEGYTERRPRRGRPGTRYVLTDKGERLFPDRSAALAGELLEFLDAEDDLDRFLAWRRGRQRARYARALNPAVEGPGAGAPAVDDPGAGAPAVDDPGAGAPVADGVERRVQALADELTADGYQAGVERTTDDEGRTVLRLVQQHCAIRSVAAERPELCDAEERLFGDLLGVGVVRRQTQAGGADTCVCDIPVGEQSPAPTDAGPARDHEGDRG